MIGRRFLGFTTAAAVFLAAVPLLVAIMSTPSGGRLLGFPVAADDQMVYAAWTRQAQQGAFLFDNRFAVDPQPGLTFHLYFLILGWIAKITGVVPALHLGRLLAVGAFVPLLARFISRLKWDVATQKLALGLTIVGGGIGFLVWHDFGIALVRPESSWLAGRLLSKLPTDVWQTEAFVFPAMLENGLFVASGCLLLVALTALIDAREGWRPVIVGALATGVLMNVHSYDVVIVAAVAVGLAACALATKGFTFKWAVRAAVIGAGAIPASLWFVHVLANDPVFQARAATPTYAGNFRATLAGLLPLILLGGVSLWGRGERARIGVGVAAAGVMALWLAAGTHLDGFFMGPPGFAAAFVVTVVVAALVAKGEPGEDLVSSWAILSLILPFFPALFQRKLGMMQALPWGILAAQGLGIAMRGIPAGQRRLPLALATLVLGAGSVRWFARDLQLVRSDVSTTTMQPMTLTAGVARLIEKLPKTGRVVVVAPPGVPSARQDEKGQPVPDTFGAPLVPDLNPILAGLAGVYAYAGHWSETPEYGRRRAFVGSLYTGRLADPLAELRGRGIDYVVAPDPEAFPGVGFVPLDGLGEVVFSDGPFHLIRL